jgi:endo-1,4-beta-mannosidase
MLREFGLFDKSKRNPTYKQWTDTTFSVGGAGALYWLLAGLQEEGTPYPDYDGFNEGDSPVVSVTYWRYFGVCYADSILGG